MLRLYKRPDCTDLKQKGMIGYEAQTF